ncbi:CRAL-TRIO domain-containing protein [Cladorrhinum sp. PSN259]|nr:CRAL-TRIO domain-containing protein [Cladorrhinum sp. PSN259]
METFESEKTNGKHDHVGGLMAGLNQDERSAFDAFLQLCNSRGWLTERPAGLGSADACHGLNDEATLLRFLKARSFNVDGAAKQFQESLAIRNSVDAIAAYDSIDVAQFERARSMYPHWSGRRDKRGLPVCIFDIAHLDADALASYGKQRATVDGTTRQAIVFHDYLTRFVLPLCSAMKPGEPVTSAVYLVDIGSFTLKQAWSVRGYAQDISKLLATCYPEVIDRVYVLNAAPYFAKIWSLIKKWVDPRTASKFIIVPSTEVMPTLLETMDAEDIPKQYGGRFDAEHGMTPRLDKDIQQALTWVSTSSVGEGLKLPRGPLKWVVKMGEPAGSSDGNGGDGGEMAAVAVGSKDGVARTDVIALRIE